MENKKRKWLISLVLVAGLFFTFLPAMGAILPLPVIYQTDSDPVEGKLFIWGKNFGTNRYPILLGDEVIEVNNIPTWTPEAIVAQLPAGVTSGTHLLTVFTGKYLPFAVMSVTIGGGQGEVGPQGPAGEPVQQVHRDQQEQLDRQEQLGRKGFRESKASRVTKGIRVIRATLERRGPVLLR